MSYAEDFEELQNELYNLTEKYGVKIGSPSVISALQMASTSIINSFLQQSMLGSPEKLEEMFTKFAETPGLIKMIEDVVNRLSSTKE